MSRTNGHSHNGSKKQDGRGKHPNSIANLRPVQPGEARNPLGRPAAGASVREHWNSMQDWTKAEIEAVVQDENAPACKVSAARIWLYAMSNERTSSGAPIAGSELERIMEHTAGKARQSLEVSGGLDHRHAERSEANRMLGNPAAREAAMRLAELAGEQAMPDVPSEN